MKGRHNLKPTRPKYSFTGMWVLSINLKHLSTLTNDYVFDLLGKLATVFCGQRAREILAVLDLKISPLRITIIRIEDVLNTSTRNFHSGELKFPAYHEDCICSVETMRQYIKETEALRGETTRLFYYNHKTIQENLQRKTA